MIRQILISIYFLSLMTPILASAQDETKVCKLKTFKKSIDEPVFTECNKGDVLFFRGNKGRTHKHLEFMARVCVPGTVYAHSFQVPEYYICEYRGKILNVVEP